MLARLQVEHARALLEAEGIPSEPVALPVSAWLASYGTDPEYPSKRVRRITEKAYQKASLTPWFGFSLSRADAEGDEKFGYLVHLSRRALNNCLYHEASAEQHNPLHLADTSSLSGSGPSNVKHSAP